MEEATARAILKDIVSYLNLATRNCEAMSIWIYHRLAKRGYDCIAKERKFDLYNDREMIKLAFSVMSNFEETTDTKEKKWLQPVMIPFPPIEVQVVFNMELPHKAFNLKNTGVNGLLFVMRLAASVTNWNKAHRCKLCQRSFFSKNAGSAKWCHNSCKTTNSRIKTGKRKNDSNVRFWDRLRDSEIKILKDANKMMAADKKEGKNECTNPGKS